MRLIDADALEAEIRENIRRYYSMEKEVRSGYCTAQDAADEVKYAPTVDAVEVSCRCKDCKHWKHFDHLGCTEFVKVCGIANYMIGANGYCLYGERREENG